MKAQIITLSAALIVIVIVGVLYATTLVGALGYARDVLVPDVVDMQLPTLPNGSATRLDVAP